MGCDIHMHVEYKREQDTEWRSGDYYVFDDKDGYRFVEFYGDRDYNLFAMLANVRNYELGLPYVSAPKGFPEDAHPLTRTSYDIWRDDAHSCSYLSLQELIDFYYDLDEEEHEEIIKDIINGLKRRAHELCLIMDYEWEWSTCKDKAYKKAANIRIVFWFDN